jgi:hypothetical protein
MPGFVLDVTATGTYNYFCALEVQYHTCKWRLHIRFEFEFKLCCSGLWLLCKLVHGKQSFGSRRLPLSFVTTYQITWCQYSRILQFKCLLYNVHKLKWVYVWSHAYTVILHVCIRFWGYVVLMWQCDYDLEEKQEWKSQPILRYSHLNGRNEESIAASAGTYTR